MRLLTLCSALAHVSAGVVEDDVVLAERAADVERGQAGRLVLLVRDLLAEGHWAGGERCVAVTVGPGGFTGIRAALALAHGLGAGAGVPVIGVTVGEALVALRPEGASAAAWTAIDSRRGQVFLDIDGKVRSVALADLPAVSEPVQVLGDAADAAAARLRALGGTASVGARWPAPRGIARAALARLGGALPPRPALPLYVHPPAVKLPADGLRPAPVA